jgi:hypothetical protein
MKLPGGETARSRERMKRAVRCCRTPFTGDGRLNLTDPPRKIRMATVSG